MTSAWEGRTGFVAKPTGQETGTRAPIQGSGFGVSFKRLGEQAGVRKRWCPSESLGTWSFMIRDGRNPGSQSSWTNGPFASERVLAFELRA